MRGQGYDAEQRVSVTQFTTAQRQRLESVTAAKLLLGSAAHTNLLLDVADYIATGKR